MNSIDLERRVLKLERAIYNNYKFNKVNENVSLNTFDCDRLESILEDNLANYRIEIDINTDNADNGFINVGISSDNGDDDYDVIATKYNSYDLLNNDKKIGTFNTLSKVADAISDHFEETHLI